MLKCTIYLGFIISILASCKIPSSLHPLSGSESEIVYDTTWAGTWITENDTLKISVKDTDKKILHCTIRSWNDERLTEQVFNIQVVALQHLLFIDAWLDSKSIDKNAEELIDNYTLPRHFFYKLELKNKDTFDLVSPNIEAISELVKKRKLKLKIITPGNDQELLIISDTKELQKALLDFEKFAPAIYKEKVSYRKLAG